MVERVAIRRAEGSVTVTIPADMAERHHMMAGEDAFIVETDQGELLTACDPALDKAMRVYERGAHQFRDALRELAK